MSNITLYISFDYNTVEKGWLVITLAILQQNLRLMRRSRGEKMHEKYATIQSILVETNLQFYKIVKSYESPSRINFPHCR